VTVTRAAGEGFPAPSVATASITFEPESRSRLARHELVHWPWTTGRHWFGPEHSTHRSPQIRAVPDTAIGEVVNTEPSAGAAIETEGGVVSMPMKWMNGYRSELFASIV